VSGFRVERFALEPLAFEVAGAANAGGAWRRREGIGLRVVGGGQEGWGEASPLPGYSPDTLEDARAELAALGLEGVELRADWRALEGLARGVRSPSARFALESALLDLAARHASAPAHRLLRPFVPGPRRVAEVSAAALGGGGGLEAEVRALEARGVAALKIKVGRPGAWAEERAALARAAAAARRLELRVDANQAFGDEAPPRLEELAALRITLAEEPAPPESWLEGRGASPPLALDESLRRPDAAAILVRAAPRLGAIVLKPAVLGGLGAALAWADRAAALGVPSVLSHLFDGPVAAAALRTLALALPPGGPAHGLGLARAGGVSVEATEAPGAPGGRV
jgi:o-succinylbenzoate synthase